MSASPQLDEDRAESGRMIRDSAAAVAPRQGTLERIRKLRFQLPGFDPAVWRQMGEMGWIGLRLAEERGGSGLGMTEACSLAEELGRGLVPEPLIAGALSAHLLTAAGAADTPILPRLLAGEIVVVTAWQEAVDTLSPAEGRETDRLFVPMAAGAAMFLVPVSENGKLALYALAREGQQFEARRTQDGGHVGTLKPGLAGAMRLSGDIGPTLARALDEAALATAAYLLGMMERSFEMTLDYLRTRHQFGRPLGSFQALQHRAADLKIQLSLSRASIERAAAELDTGVAAARRQAVVSRAKARAAEAAMKVTREAVQLHGAIGYTDEYDVGLFLRKAMATVNQFGSAAFHRRRFMAASGDEAG